LAVGEFRRSAQLRDLEIERVSDRGTELDKNAPSV
jgi:hypothetical protein